MCMCAFNSNEQDNDANGSSTSNQHIIIASSEGTIQVFVDFVLSWAAKIPTIPLQMTVSQFGPQKGLVVSMDDTGNLSIGYLGTKPPVNAVLMSGANSAVAVNSIREMNYDKIDEEHRALLQVS